MVQLAKIERIFQIQLLFPDVLYIPDPERAKKRTEEIRETQSPLFINAAPNLQSYLFLSYVIVQWRGWTALSIVACPYLCWHPYLSPQCSNKLIDSVHQYDPILQPHLSSKNTPMNPVQLLYLPNNKIPVYRQFYRASFFVLFSPTNIDNNKKNNYFCHQLYSK